MGQDTVGIGFIFYAAAVFNLCIFNDLSAGIDYIIDKTGSGIIGNGKNRILCHGIRALQTPLVIVVYKYFIL